ncbi:MAG: recombinase family protein [Candidatus Pacearchaeota archaeon]|jgi:hypothetical protein
MNSSTCAKCGFVSINNFSRFGLPLCSICIRFAPRTPEKLDEYVEEKINSETLETFRKFSEIGRPQLNSMTKKAESGSPMSRPAFGYKFEDKNLVPAINSKEVEEIFEEFLNNKISLTQLAKKHNFSVNGLKKILTNFTYIGKIKFNNKIHKGNHEPIISTTLFNHVQNKLEKLGIKKK